MSLKSSSISLLVLCFSLLLVSCFASSSSPTTTTATTSVHEWDSWEGKGEKLVLPYYHKLKDVKDNEKVQAIGSFVVHLVNRKHGKNAHPLVFSGVTMGEMADFAGDYYYNLTVSTIENNVTKMFVTIVTIPKNVGIGPAKVVSFEPISSTRKGVTLARSGGIMEIKDVKNKKEAQEKGNYAVKEYNNKHKNGSPLTFLEVIEGRYQVVAGTKYYLTISATQNGVRKLFSAVVVSPATPYDAPDELISFTPQYTSSSPKVGGIMEIKDVKHNNEAQEKGRFSVKEYNDKHQNGTPLIFLEVVKGEYQVVAGFKYYLTISATQNGVKKMFYAVVLSPATPYNAPDELMSFTPLPSSSPPLLGKPVVIKDVKHNKRAQQLGKFAVKEYNGGSKNKTPLKFVEVVRGQYQVVAGLKYTLDISVINGGVKDSARATVLVKPGPSAEKELISFFIKESMARRNRPSVAGSGFK